MTSPTQRSMKHLRDNGWHPVIVERWDHFAKIRRDLFGFADIIAMREGDKPILVQTTTGSNMAARREKILASDVAALCLRSGFRIVLHGWRKVKVKRGGLAMRWEVREEELERPAPAEQIGMDLA